MLICNTHTTLVMVNRESPKFAMVPEDSSIDTSSECIHKQDKNRDLRDCGQSVVFMLVYHVIVVHGSLYKRATELVTL